METVLHVAGDRPSRARRQLQLWPQAAAMRRMSCTRTCQPLNLKVQAPELASCNPQQDGKKGDQCPDPRRHNFPNPQHWRPAQGKALCTCCKALYMLVKWHAAVHQRETKVLVRTGGAEQSEDEESQEGAAVPKDAAVVDAGVSDLDYLKSRVKQAFQEEEDDDAAAATSDEEMSDEQAAEEADEVEGRDADGSDEAADTAEAADADAGEDADADAARRRVQLVVQLHTVADCLPEAIHAVPCFAAAV